MAANGTSDEPRPRKRGACSWNADWETNDSAERAGAAGEKPAVKAERNRRNEGGTAISEAGSPLPTIQIKSPVNLPWAKTQVWQPIYREMASDENKENLQ